MPQETKVQEMDLADLADWCAHETELYFQHQVQDPRYCFELFRRAIREQDQAAWNIICVNYEPLVAGWVRRHPRFETGAEEVQYFVNGAFGKIARTLTADKFGGFSDLGSLLRYLKMCVHSVIVDHDRQAEQAAMSALDEIPEKASMDPSPEEQAIEGSFRRALWDLLNARLQDEKERLVVYGSFVLAIKPQEVFTLHRNLFGDVEEVYRVKQNVIARLRRDPEIRKLLSLDD